MKFPFIDIDLEEFVRPKTVDHGILPWEIETSKNEEETENFSVGSVTNIILLLKEERNLKPSTDSMEKMKQERDRHLTETLHLLSISDTPKAPACRPSRSVIMTPSQPLPDSEIRTVDGHIDKRAELHAEISASLYHTIFGQPIHKHHDIGDIYPFNLKVLDLLAENYH